MKHIIVGLGNPGEEYENTRHNAGRMVVAYLAEHMGASDWRDDKKLCARVAKAVTKEGDDVVLILPDNYMNRSGTSVTPLIKTERQAKTLVVVHDDIDLPVGTIRIVFDRGSGGHRGVDSIVRAIKTRAFVRVRVGVVPTTPTGKLKKPSGEGAVHDFILKQLTKKDRDVLDEAVVYAAKATEAVVEFGSTYAMQHYNGSMERAERPTRKPKK
jgi:PTH1 family peptidyl-tRNA hydrolase